MGKYRYDIIMETYAEHGANFDAPSRARDPAPRDRKGKLEYWTREAQEDIDRLDFWSGVESLDRLSKAREQNGRSGKTALFTALVFACQCRLAQIGGMCVRHMREDGSDPDSEYKWFWSSTDVFRIPGSAFEDMERRFLHSEDGSAAQALPGIEGICLLASPQECLEGLAGGKEVSKRVFDRLTETCRASCSPGRGRGSSASPAPCRP